MIFSNKYLKKTTSSEKLISTVQVIPILTENQLLANLKSQSWLNRIQSYLNLPDEHFEILYIKLIEEFAAFVQILPATTEGKLGSLLSEGLGRAILALKILYESDPEKVQSDPRYAYAIFSAALLVNIGQVTNTKITISDSKGYFVSDWFPYQGSLVGKGEYYKIYRYAHIPPHLTHHAAPILARQIMPESGFLWIAEDMRLLHMWLALLLGDRANVGSFDFILSIPLDEMMQELNVSLEGIEIERPLETQEAENFLYWLQKGIENDQLPINTKDAQVITLNEGVFISLNLFKEFSNSYSHDPYSTLLQSFVNHLGLSEDKFFLEYLKPLANQRQKIDFKENKGINNFLSKELKHANALAKERSQKVEGILIKDKHLLLKADQMDTASFVKGVSTKLSDQLPKLISTIDKVFAAH